MCSIFPLAIWMYGIEFQLFNIFTKFSIYVSSEKKLPGIRKKREEIIYSEQILRRGKTYPSILAYRSKKQRKS